MEQTVIGQYNSAKVFTDVVEQSALDQIRTLCDQPFTQGATIRVMPDVHAGAGCTIGTTMTISDAIVPNLVG
ncbi:MAG: RtcB family protein, partial [Clostridia bacterium]|nr:RtcB family protein [Clostridia bacterium]